jgi:ribonuclease HI
VINGCANGPVRIAKWIGHQDNNVAEYAALMEALQYALSLKAQKLHVYSDSEVMVRQMTGQYVCRSPRLYSLHWTCRKLARTLKFSISYVPRENNVEANGLCRDVACNVSTNRTFGLVLPRGGFLDTALPPSETPSTASL